MQRIERAYRVFLRCRDVVRVSATEEELFTQLCRIAVDELGYRLAWVGLVVPGDPEVRPVGHAGYEEGYLEHLHIRSDDVARGRGPTGRAIREGRTVVAQEIATDPRFEPWREDALRRGYASSVALPLLGDRQVLGALNLYAPEPNAFDDEEIALLEQVALDLVVGVQRIRLQGVLQDMDLQMSRMMRIEAAGLAASGLAHDFNNLLQVVGLSISMARDAVDPVGRERSLDEAQRAVDAMARLGEKLLSLTRRAAGMQEICEVDAVVRSMVPLLRRLAPSAQFSTHQGADGAWAPIASVDLERILVNLVVNAEHAMLERGTVALTTAVRVLDAPTDVASATLAPGAYVVLEVVDQGVGIAPDVLPRIFEPLFTTKDDQGSGLGLPSVRAAVAPVGGGIDVASAVGEGTRVSVFLPSRGLDGWSGTPLDEDH